MHMKCKVVFMMLFASVLSVHAQTVSDSLSTEMLDQAVVSSVRVQKNAPFAVANVKRADLETFSKTGRELPFLFSYTPGVLAWSDNGTGVGTSYLRIRGAGDSRINVTIDGMPLNSPEDECVFWANMNSYSAMLESVQIQRGAGSSTSAPHLPRPPRIPRAVPPGASCAPRLLRPLLVAAGGYHSSGTAGYPAR